VSKVQQINCISVIILTILIVSVTIGQAQVINTKDTFLIIVGLGSVDGGINIEQAQSGEWVDGLYVKSRAALYLEGTIKGADLKIAFDNSRPSVLSVVDIADEQYYPVYGDGSVLDKEATKHGNLYVLIEVDQASLRYGIERSLIEVGDFLSFKQEVRGVDLQLKPGIVEVGVVYGYTMLPVITKQFPGDQRLIDDEREWEQFLNITGPLFLDQTPVATDSETIWIEVRSDDPLAVLLDKRELKPDEYTIDYFTGRIIINEYISWIDKEGNLVNVVVEYEHIDQGQVPERVVGFTTALNIGKYGSVDMGFVKQGETTPGVWGLELKLQPVMALTIEADVAGTQTTWEAHAHSGKATIQMDDWRLSIKNQWVGPYFLGIQASPQVDRSTWTGVLEGSVNNFQLQANYERTMNNLLKLPTELTTHSEKRVLKGVYTLDSGIEIILTAQQQFLDEIRGIVTEKDILTRTGELEVVIPISSSILTLGTALVDEQNLLHEDGTKTTRTNSLQLEVPQLFNSSLAIVAGNDWSSVYRGQQSLQTGTHQQAEITFPINEQTDLLAGFELNKTNMTLLNRTEIVKEYTLGTRSIISPDLSVQFEQGLQNKRINQQDEFGYTTSLQLNGELKEGWDSQIYAQRVVSITDINEKAWKVGSKLEYLTPTSNLQLNYEWNLDQWPSNNKVGNMHSLDIKWQLSNFTSSATYRIENTEEKDLLSGSLSTTWQVLPELTFHTLIEKGEKKIDNAIWEYQHRGTSFAYRSRGWADILGTYQTEQTDHTQTDERAFIRFTSVEGIVYRWQSFDLTFKWVNRIRQVQNNTSTSHMVGLGAVIPLGEKWSVGSNYWKTSLANEDEVSTALSVETRYNIVSDLQLRLGYNLQPHNEPGFNQDINHPKGLTFGVDFKF
jgi:hypothetical protein